MHHIREVEQGVPSLGTIWPMSDEPRLNPQVVRSRAAAMSSARDILFGDGWDAVTHAEVAERSGVGRTTLYRHWPTIDQLLRDVLLAECSMSHPEPSGNTQADLVAELDAFRDQLQDPEMERVMVTIMDRASVNPEFAQLRDAMYRACSQALAGIVRKAKAAGQVDADLDVVQAVAELAGPLVFQQFVGHKQVGRTFIERVVESFLQAHGRRR
jgi:AcrR family transcriptional regulator